MSIESVARALLVPGLTQAERLVLVGIANHDGDGGAWPSIKTLAGYSCVSERAVQMTIASMRDKGWLIVHRNQGGTLHTRSDRRPNWYEIVWDALPQRDEAHFTPSVERGEVQRVHGVKPTSPEPSLEPSIPPYPPKRHRRSPQREWRPYDDQPLSPEQIAEKYGCEA